MDLNTIRFSPERLDGVWWTLTAERGVLTGVPTFALKEPNDALPEMLILPKGPEYQRVLMEEQYPHREAFRKGEADGKLLIQINARALARTVLRGWKKIVIDGKPIEWTEKVAADMLSDPQWRAIYEWVEVASENRAVLLKEEEELAKGN